MSSDPKFVDYVVDQAKKSVLLTFRKMFGEYALYANGKVVALVCDDSLYLKPTAAGKALLPSVTEQAPYPGAKNWLLIDADLDNAERLGELLTATERNLPPPKQKKKSR